MDSLVDSSVLSSVAYSTANQTLDLTFRSGVTYRYFDVPATLVEGLMAAESKGAYFNQRLRDHFTAHRQD